MAAPPLPESHLVTAAPRPGSAAGGVLLVHCAFSRVKPVEGGPVGLIRALRAALGSQGTLVMQA